MKYKINLSCITIHPCDKCNHPNAPCYLIYDNNKLIGQEALCDGCKP